MLKVSVRDGVLPQIGSHAIELITDRINGLLCTNSIIDMGKERFSVLYPLHLYNRVGLTLHPNPFFDEIEIYCPRQFLRSQMFVDQLVARLLVRFLASEALDGKSSRSGSEALHDGKVATGYRPTWNAHKNRTIVRGIP